MAIQKHKHDWEEETNTIKCKICKKKSVPNKKVGLKHQNRGRFGKCRNQ